MRALASTYLIVAAVALFILFLFQIPGVLTVLVIYTMGFGYFLVLPVFYIGFWIVAFAPAALGAWANWRIGAGIAVVILALAVTFPHWLPDPTHQGTALLEPPFSATSPLAVRSVEVTSLGSTPEMRAIVETAVEALKRNTDLDWVRIDGKVFERTKGILHEVRLNQDNFQRVADVIVTVPSRRHAAVWGNASLSPWRAKDVSGYVIHDTRTDKSLARNLSLKLERARKPLSLTVTGVSVDGSADPKIEFVRAIW